MNIQINLNSINAKKLADFYAEAFDLCVKEIKYDNIGKIYYSCMDGYGSGFFIEQTDHNTEGLSIAIKVPSAYEKRKDLQDKGFELDNLGPEESFFSFNDPQGNRIAIIRE